MIKPTTRITVIFSLLFFSLFVFTNLTLFTSQFSNSFSHLFLIFIRENQFFDNLSVLFFFCGFLLSSAFVIISSWHKTSNTLQRIIMLTLSIIFIYLVILKTTHIPETEDIMDLFAIEGSIYHRDFFELITDYLGRIVFILGVYAFFVYIPLLFLIFGLRPNQDNQIGEMLYNMRPSMNIIIVVLFALCIQPYYYRDNLYAYLDIIALFGGVGLLIYVMFKHKELFGFYEYMNFALLILGIIICIICTSVLSISDNYFNARYAFLVFAFVGWCAEWMYNNIKPIED
ncbi:hypothetical protein LS71_004965 [Helicobacter jaachi]|uniref:Uncharacterized protein n=1 Tax=Helicobacter jaachi TaxID=1677920 RepID=A0A4U8TB83_9HELI|nr:hypothetical protein [Helicobacter jaachi]TLD96944.1 hypothetical protein LS71_004965 [Helicobacter jaachi]